MNAKITLLELAGGVGLFCVAVPCIIFLGNLALEVSDRIVRRWKP